MTKLKNFTPLLDSLTRQYDLDTSALWGRVWRYQQGKRGVCQVPHETLAEGLNLSRRTVIRKLAVLVADGYIIDHTPDLRNKPHTLTTTEKARLETVVIAHDDGVTESHTGVTESHSQSDRESHEDTIRNKVRKKDSSPNGDRPSEKPKTEYVIRSELLEDVFAKARGCSPPAWKGATKAQASEYNKTWRTPLNDMWRKAGKDTGLTCLGIQEVVKQMVDDRLTFSNPVQIKKTFESWLIDQRQPAKPTAREVHY